MSNIINVVTNQSEVGRPKSKVRTQRFLQNNVFKDLNSIIIFDLNDTMEPDSSRFAYLVVDFLKLRTSDF
jgi:hypothetical protein